MFLRYPGGKSKVADLILRYMPSGTKEYREPFVGGGSVFLNVRSTESRWINDLNPGLIAVYKAFRDRPDEFIAKCREILPASPGEDEIATKGTGKKYNKRLGIIFNAFKADEGMDQALRYFFINRTVWGGRVTYDPSCSSRLYYSNPNGWNLVHKPGLLESVAARIAGTLITCGDYEHLFTADGDNVWLYLDPPYCVDTKLSKQSKLYEFGFNWDDHKRFVEMCRGTKHRIAISYDDVLDVREWFKGFHIYEHSWTYSGTSNKEKVRGKELVITNYERNEALFTGGHETEYCF
jgi:DNA adenine methylase